MTNEMISFYWNANAENCIAILNYEFQGVCEVVNDSYSNDESPSCAFQIDGITYKLFFPSNYKGDYCKFLLLEEIEDPFEIRMIDEYTTIAEVIEYFKKLNVI